MGYLVLKERNAKHSIKEYIPYENEYIRPVPYNKGEKGLYNLSFYKNGECIAWYIIFKELVSLITSKNNTSVILRFEDKVFIINKSKDTEVSLARITDNVQAPKETYFI